MINKAFSKPPETKNPEVSYMEKVGGREWVRLYQPHDQETPCPERRKHNGRSKVGKPL